MKRILEILAEMSKRIDGPIEQQQHVERTVSMFYHEVSKLKVEDLKARIARLEKMIM